MRKYTPFLVIPVTAFLAIAVLPSSLKNPLVNPTETPEYAPITGAQGTSSGGNSSTFGFGSGSRLGQTSFDDRSTSLLGSGNSLGKNPTTKRCIGHPPRQTEDPQAPPCVPFFEGNNFGSTHPGVSRDEVRIMFYYPGGQTSVDPEDNPGQDIPKNIYYDLAKPPGPNEHSAARILRAYQRYFNDRYQTYGRFVHFYMYYHDQFNSTPEKGRADAADNFAKVAPFAVIARGSTQNSYSEWMVQHRVMSFDAGSSRTEESFRQYPGFLWSYTQPIGKKAELFADFVCTQVIPFPVSFSGNTSVLGQTDNGLPRKLGLLWTNDPKKSPEFKNIVKRQVESCGGRFLEDKTYPRDPGSIRSGDSSEYQVATAALSAFRNAGVTTIVWPGGLNTNFSHAASHLNYLPEWVVAGGVTNIDNKDQEPTAWRHARLVSDVRLVTNWEQEQCYLAYKEADPDSPIGTPKKITNTACLQFYDQLRQFFTGIQGAGPRLTPESVEKGFRAIPILASPNPRAPACFYEPGDYTCVKDAVAEWWDPEGSDPTPDTYGPKGCWRMAENGKRYLLGTWPRRDVPQPSLDNICNGWDPAL